MNRIRFYIDEDAMHRGLTVGLRARRVDVITAAEAGMVSESDEDHLRWASANQRVLYSFNMVDFCSIHATWLSRGESHWGIVLASQQRYGVGEQLRALLRLMNQRTPAEMENRLEYLATWRL